MDTSILMPWFFNARSCRRRNTKMGQKRSAAKRGTMSKQHWEDIRQAARLARTEGVMLTIHGVKVDPLKAARTQDSAKELEPSHKLGKKGQAPKADKDAQPMDTTGDDSLSKKQQRSKQRLSDFREAKRADERVGRWLLMTRLICRQIRAKLLADTWTAWMRAKCARAKLRSTLRPIMWREWTRPSEQVTAALLSGEGPRPISTFNGKPTIGLCSPRDAYILRRARALAHHAPRARISRSVRIGWLHQRPAPDDDSDEDIEEVPPLEEDDDHGGPTADDAPLKPRTKQKAGLQTPGSQPRGRKKTRGRRSP
jgi:hypothetical protein